MDLRGRIELFGVANIFQLLQQAEASGKLVLEGSGESARVYFHQGSLIYARTDADVERIGEVLVGMGALESTQLEGARIKAERQGRRIGSVLVESGSIERDDLVRAIREQIKSVVYRLVRLRSGSFTYHAQIYPETEDILLDVSLDMLLLEGFRQLDELEHGRSSPDSPSG